MNKKIVFFFNVMMNNVKKKKTFENLLSPMHELFGWI